MTLFGLININTVLQTYKTHESNLGIRLSIILHTIFVCILVSMKHSTPSVTLPPQYVEVANLTLKPDLKSDIYSDPSHLDDPIQPTPIREKLQASPDERLETKMPPEPASISSNDNSSSIINEDSNLSQSAGSSEFGTGPVGGGLGVGDGTGTGVSSGAGDNAVESNRESVVLGDSGFWNEYGSKLQIICDRYKYYPKVAARRGWQGTTEVLIHFFPDGKTVNITIAKSAGQKVLDNQAIDMVKKGLAELPLPSNYLGRDVKLIMPIDFKLEYIQV
jgi:protein TonB